MDEWQLVPRIWDAVRHAVDAVSGIRGAWILTGSSTPATGEVSHSGAGRIGRVRMRPMSLSESGDSTAAVSLSGLFEGDFQPVRVETSSDGIAALCCRGGWPEDIGMDPDDAQELARAYLDAVARASMPALGRNPDMTRRLLISLARNDGQGATIKTLRADMAGGDDSDLVTTKTVSVYLSDLVSMYLIDLVHGWAPPAHSPKRVQVKEKRYYADPSPAVAALGMSVRGLLGDWQSFGLVFENLCMRDLLVYASALRGAAAEPVRYYHDESGLEADCIIEMADGRWAVIEVKLSDDKVDEAETHLLAMRRKLCENPKAKVREPEFMAVIVGIAEYARRTSAGTYVIPITCLGA
ncbi:MAG: DUF4143 domain-containing protein [Atopobiaceae bacterium]|nr:DUF4143 domain-containing protein [Atopobiaceae bacterium]